MRLQGNTAATNERVPRLGPGVDPTRLELTPAEGYLLSRIDGATSWTHLRAIGGIGPDEVDRCLERWVADGVVVVEGTAPLRASPPPGNRRPARTPPRRPNTRSRRCRATSTRASTFPSKSRSGSSSSRRSSISRTTRSWACRATPTARRCAKRTSRSRGSCIRIAFSGATSVLRQRLERIFGKIVEAYELLSDPMARAEIERSLAAASGDLSAATSAAVEAAAAAPETPPEAPPRSEAQRATPAPPPRTRRPHVFSLHSRIVRDRRARAKRLFEAGMASFAGGRWLEAAGSVRLAIAFDPWNAVYKEQFADVQRRAHEERAKQLTREAEAALELRDFATALRAFSDALEYRPHDADLLHRAARLAWATGGDLHQAKEWARRRWSWTETRGPSPRARAGLQGGGTRGERASRTRDRGDDRSEGRGGARRVARVRRPRPALAGGKR